MKPLNVLCIKWKKYAPDYVNTLYSTVSRHLTGPVRLICLIDDWQGVRGEVGVKAVPWILMTPCLAVVKNSDKCCRRLGSPNTGAD